MIGKIKKKLKLYLRENAWVTPKDLEYQLALRAANTTCEYIEKQMLQVESKTTPQEVLDVALSKVSLEGLFLEFGVFSGKSINQIARKFPDQKVYGFDSFEGLPEFWRDGFKKGFFSLEGNLPKVESNVSLVKGWFSDTLPEFTNKEKAAISFLHVDCDLYSSTKTIFSSLAKQIEVGTVIVFDEYFNYVGWQEGEFKAFKELVSKFNIEYDYICYNRKHEQVAVVIKSIAKK
jgi:predicted O-methyltransferase YrrM